MAHPLKAAADYDRLSHQIMKVLNEYLSPTTLKRFWGYLPAEQVKPRLHTLDVLARFAGYRSFAQFSEQTGSTDSSTQMESVQSGFLEGVSITPEDLDIGQIITLTWNPDRKIVVRHQGKGYFRVEEVENSKLCVGDTFRCRLMIQHEPLYMDDLVHLGQPPVSYVAGMRDGVVIMC